MLESETKTISWARKKLELNFKQNMRSTEMKQ